MSLHVSPRSVSLFAVCAAPFFSCGSDSSGNAGSTPNANAGDALVLESKVYTGPNLVTGTVSVASAVKAGSRMGIAITDASLGSLDTINISTVNQIKNITTTEEKMTFSYEIRNLKAGNYLVSVYVDANNDNQIGENDIAGYYGGTADTPAQYGKNAKILNVTGNLTGIDFGIGPTQCKARYGQSCSSDDGCRGTNCASASGGSTHVSKGACDGASKTCKAAACPSNLTAAEAACFGDF